MSKIDASPRHTHSLEVLNCKWCIRRGKKEAFQFAAAHVRTLMTMADSGMPAQMIIHNLAKTLDYLADKEGDDGV